MSTKKEAEKSPLDTLAERVGPCSNTHCHGGTVDVLDVRGTRLEDCPACGGTSVPCPGEPVGAEALMGHGPGCRCGTDSVKLKSLPLDTLAERVRRKVPCPFCQGRGIIRDVPEDGQSLETVCAECAGKGTVLDPRWAALREALWEECPCGCHGWIGQKESPPVDPRCLESKCPGFVRRTRAEAALRLPDAIFEAGCGVEMSRGPKGGHDWHCMVAWQARIGGDWLDALAAALLAWMDAQEGVKDPREEKPYADNPTELYCKHCDLIYMTWGTSKRCDVCGRLMKPAESERMT